MAQELLELQAVIRAWENSLFHEGFLMSPATRVIVESTITHLKRLYGLSTQNASTGKTVEQSL